jgi:hypothetical protein
MRRLGMLKDAYRKYFLIGQCLHSDVATWEMDRKEIDAPLWRNLSLFVVICRYLSTFFVKNYFCELEGGTKWPGRNQVSQANVHLRCLGFRPANDCVLMVKGMPSNKQHNFADGRYK